MAAELDGGTMESRWSCAALLMDPALWLRASQAFDQIADPTCRRQLCESDTHYTSPDMESTYSSQPVTLFHTASAVSRR